MSSYPPYYAYPSAPPVVRAVPDPPRLHWGVVFALSVITLGYFSSIWFIVQSMWVRKVYGRSKALPWAIVNACILPVFFVFAFGAGIIGVLAHQDVDAIQSVIAIVTTFVRVLIFVAFIVTAYTLRGELEATPIRIPLGGVMTFFFGAIYFQYHLFDYQVSDEVHQFRGPLRTELAPGPETSQPQS
jgi:hypothetical protein